MRIKIIQKAELNEEQTAQLRQRLAADEHLTNSGLLFQDWEKESQARFLFVVLFKESNEPIGLLYRGGPEQATAVSYWLDQKFRGIKIGNEMIDLFADLLKEEGVTGIGQLSIVSYQGQDNIASEKLACRLKAHFG